MSIQLGFNFYLKAGAVIDIYFEGQGCKGKICVYITPSENPAQPMQPDRAPRRTITLDIPEPLIDWLDKQANSLTISRSAFVRMMITRAMSAQS